MAVARSPEQGTGSTQALTNNMIEQLAPRWIFVVGIAGGFPDSDFTLGDVLLSKRIHDFSVSAALEALHQNYVESFRPFLCYYFIRYALSFVCPALKAHKEDMKICSGRIERIKASRRLPFMSSVIVLKLRKIVNENFYSSSAMGCG